MMLFILKCCLFLRIARIGEAYTQRHIFATTGIHPCHHMCKRINDQHNFQFRNKFGAPMKYINRHLVQNSISSFYMLSRWMAFSETSEMTKPKVLVPVADGSEEIETVTIIDTLVRGGVCVTVASISHNLTLHCSRGVKITADCVIDSCSSTQWDMIVCPGGMPGADHLSQNHCLIDMLRNQLRRGAYIGAICAAPAVILAKHHMLEGRRATCYPSERFASKIKQYVADQRVVVDGNIVTSQGPGTAMEFALTLVHLLSGEEKAQSVREDLIYP